jgi:hypothetical protein
VTSIPYVGTQAFRRAATRTLLTRVALAVLLVALVLAAAAAARSPRVTEQPFLPANASGVVVLDLSASITSDTYSRIEQTLRELVSRGGRYGLVVFSTSAYEALPPGTPASALAPLIRYFTVPPSPSVGAQPTFPINPWSASFTSGTEISRALNLAQQVEIASNVRHPQVLLVSDLADDPQDIQRLIGVLNQYRTNGVRLRAIALNAAPNDAAFFARLIGSASSIIPADLAPPRASSPAPPTSSFPTLLVVLAVAVAILLGVHELRMARLRFGEQPVRRAA